MAQGLGYPGGSGSHAPRPTVSYEAPTIVDIGSLHDLTQMFNKIGVRQDAASHVVPGLGGTIAPRIALSTAGH
jgi:hypothetical protein